MSGAVYDAIVLGGGPNGLLCGAYLARAGHRVALLERRHETGGGLNTEEYFGFRFNLHAVYHLMAERMPAYRDLDLASLGVRYVHPPVVAAFPLRDGQALVFTRDVEETARSIAGLSVADAAAYRRMWDEFQPMLDEYLVPMTYDLPKPGLDQMVALGATPVGQKLGEISELTFLQIVDHYGFRDPRVRMALLAFPAMWGLALDEPLGFLFPIYLCRMLAAGLVKGGSHRLSSAIYRAFVRAGGVVLDATEATRIVVGAGGVSGVECGDGSRVEGRTVVSTLNPRQTFVELLRGVAMPEDLRASAEGWQWEERSLFGLHLGVKGDVRFRAAAHEPRLDEAMIVFLGLETDDELLAHLRRVDAGDDRGGEWLHVTVPSRFDASAAPAGHAVVRCESVARYHDRWREEARSFGDAALALLARHAELGEVVLRRHHTPLDIERKLITMHRGSIKHGAYKPLQMGYYRPNDLCSRSATPVAGLFLGGASMYPGGMILGGPGYLAAQVVVEHLASGPSR
jgi:phytoene dehydrogenase-like protein